jgi:hypothetical protein
MAYSKRSYVLKPDAAELARRAELARLVDHYMLVRRTPGRERDTAYRELGIALAEHGQAYARDGWAWQWSRARNDITRQRLLTHQRIQS